MADDDLTLTGRLAAFWSTTKIDDLPAEVLRAAKRLLLDTLAAGVAGSRTEAGQAVQQGVLRLTPPGSGPSLVWGTRLHLPAPQAALVNGTGSHARELDDFGGCGHSGAVVIPAACAAAQQLGSSGRDLLVAIVAGYDVAARVMDGAGGYRHHNDRGWHSTGTVGSFGAAAAVAWLLHLPANRFASALGIAGTFTGGTWAFLVDGAMTKRLHPGKAAENGLTAAFLAEGGLTGPGYVLEAEWGGFLRTYAGETADPQAVLAVLGKSFKILRSGIKPYACCRGIHSSLDALFELMAEGVVTPDTASTIIVHGSEQTVRQLGGRQVRSVLDAQFSLPYSLAVALHSGRATLDVFSPLRADDPAIQRLMDCVEVRADTSLGPTEQPGIEVVLRDGSSASRSVPFTKGTPERPLSDEELQVKARSLLSDVIGASRCDLLIESLDRLERLSDVSDVLHLLSA